MTPRARYTRDGGPLRNMRFWLYRYFASAEALHPGIRAISPWSVRGEESGDLVGVHPVVAALVSLGRDVAVADGDEDRSARYACGADRFRHLDALGHPLMVPLLRLATIEAVAHHPQRFFADAHLPLSAAKALGASASEAIQGEVE